MRLGNKRPVVGQEPPDILHDRMHVLDVGKDVGRRHDFGRPLLAADPLGRLGGEERDRGRNAPLLRGHAHLRRLDPVYAKARLLKIAQQRPVVGTDVDYEIALRKIARAGVASRHSSAKFSRRIFVVPLGVGIFGRKQDLRIDDQPQLHELALPAAEQQGRIGRLLTRRVADRPHLVDGWQITKEQDRIERRAVADLAAFDDRARARAGGQSRRWAHRLSVLKRSANFRKARESAGPGARLRDTTPPSPAALVSRSIMGE